MPEKSTILNNNSDNEISNQFSAITNYIHSGDYESAKKNLKKLHVVDLASFIDISSVTILKKSLPLIHDDFKPEILIELSAKSKNYIVNFYGIEKISDLIQKLDVEDAIEVIEEVNEKYRQYLIDHLPSEQRQEILEGFYYPEHSAGRVMEKKFVSLYDNWSVGQAIDFIKKDKNSPEHFHAAIVTDKKHKPVGYILVSSLLKYPRSISIKEIMHSDIKIAKTNTDLEQLSYIFQRYALTIVPVINKTGKLVGAVSIDNIIYIIQEQAEEDILNLSGLQEVDLYESLVNTTKQRFPWLFVNLLTALITALIIENFSETIQKLVTLAVIMPTVASMGGNAGTQTMTVTVRAIANKEISRYHSFKVILKEFLACGLNGFYLSLIGSGVILIIFHKIDLTLVFAMAVILNFFVAGLFGSAIPLFLNFIKHDPAPASGVILTAITDSFGFFIFLFLAKFILL